MRMLSKYDEISLGCVRHIITLFYVNLGKILTKKSTKNAEGLEQKSGF